LLRKNKVEIIPAHNLYGQFLSKINNNWIYFLINSSRIIYIKIVDWKNDGISINRNAPTQDKIITNRTLHRFCDLKKADLDLVFSDLVSQVRSRIKNSKSQGHACGNPGKRRKIKNIQQWNVKNLDGVDL